MQEANKVSRFLQPSSNELSLSDLQTADLAESISNPQTENKRNTLTTTSNLHRVVFDSISIYIIKANIIFPGCIAKTPSSPFESLIIVMNFNSFNWEYKERL